MNEEVVYHGFLVVRKPQFNCRVYAHDTPELCKNPPLFQDFYYSGVDRAMWEDIDNDYYSKSLPNDIKTMYEEIREADYNQWHKWYWHGLKITPNIEQAKLLLKYANRRNPYNEIIAISSPTLSGIMQDIDTSTLSIEFLGYDVMVLGEWSLLQAGFFKRPDLFPDLHDDINHHGLLGTGSRAASRKLINSYIALSVTTDVIEPFAYEFKVEIFDVGRVKHM